MAELIKTINNYYSLCNYSFDNTYILVSNGYCVKLLNNTDNIGELVSSFDCNNIVKRCVLSNNNKYLVVILENNNVYIWNVSINMIIKKLKFYLKEKEKRW